MSEINVYATEKTFGEIFRGIYLIQLDEVNNNTGILERYFTADNSIEAENGRFGLTISNDPFIIYSQQPVFDPFFEAADGVVDESTDEVYAEFMEANRIQQIFHMETNGSAKNMYQLYSACLESGYSEGNHGYLGIWICQKIAEFMVNKKPEKIYRRIDLDSVVNSDR